MEVGATDGAEVGEEVVAAVYVGKSLVETNVDHVELVVVADQTLEEVLVAQVKTGEVVVGAVYVSKVGAILHAESGEIVVRTDEVDKVVAVANT